MPLHRFPPDHQARIAEAVSQPTPPEKWRNLATARIPNRAWWEWHWQRGIHPEKSRPPLDPVLRAQVIQRDGHTCQLCAQKADPGDIQIDHIYPYSLGGPTTLDNLQVTHSTCNARKGASV